MTESHLGETTSLCAQCKRSVPAHRWRLGDRVVMRKHCEIHGPSEVTISTNAEWYARITSLAAATEAPAEAATEVRQGCPFDCGPCTAHEQRLHLPVVPITSACNLDCPICYTHNKNQDAYHMSASELETTLATAAKLAPGRRIINITGGEPTMHPSFLQRLQQCVDAGVHRVTLSTHGLSFLGNEHWVAELARMNVRVILSFDSFEESVNERMLGGRLAAGKVRVLDMLERHRVDTTLLPVLGRGLNDTEVGALIDTALERDCIRSIEFHPLAFTGQSGAAFDRTARYTTYDALSDIETHTQGLVRVDDFVPHPLAHSLCYLVTYVLRIGDGSWMPFPRFMLPEDLRALLRAGLYIEPTPATEDMLQGIINRLWAGDIPCDRAEDVLSALRQLIRDVFAADLSPAERLRRSESYSKAIYVHTHMDEETFDTDRIRQCCVGMPGTDGTNIPSCAYNILYRERDTRYMVRPQPPLIQLGGGRRAVHQQR